jgi:hypothetical protein
MMQPSIALHDLPKVDLTHVRVVQVSDGHTTVVLWEAADTFALGSFRDREATVLTLRVGGPLDPVRRKDVCEVWQARLAAHRKHQALAASLVD